jgi:pimeloyl-ACP methyl ester carboxylesterase
LAFRGTQILEPGELNESAGDAVRRLAEQGFRLKSDFDAGFLRYLTNDVLADLKFRKRPVGNAAIHRGFLGRDLRALSDRKIYATGHSLGGAMATIAALRWPFERVVTFGEPRVGRGITEEFKGSPQSHTRYISGDDPVTKLPPTSWPFAYEHHGIAIKLEPPSGSDVRFDHSMLDYVDNLTPP